MEKLFRAWHKDAKEMLHGTAATVFKWLEDGQPVIIEQWTGLMDKNGTGIFEGDVVKGYWIETEYQTHYGDNIPLGSYTEPCGVIAKTVIKPVIYSHNSFTTTPYVSINDRDAFEEYCYNPCLLSGWQVHTRETLEQIIFPKPYHRQNEKETDESFLEVAVDIAKDLGFEISSVEDFISKMNGIEVLGNLHTSPDLIK